MNNDDNLRETIGGNWVKTNLNGTMLIELKNDVLLAVSPSIGIAQIGVKDETGVYQYAADVTFRNHHLSIYSPAISEVAINGMNAAFGNESADITNLKVSLDLSQKEKWQERFAE